MKARILRFSITILLLMALYLPASTADGKEAESVQSQGTDRPLVIIKSYYLNQDTIRPNDSFSLYISIRNDGALAAHNLIFSFSGSDFLPKETGGVLALGSLDAGQSRDIVQPMLASSSLWGQTNGTTTVSLSYNDPSGAAFSESFTITLSVLGWSGVAATPTPTITPTGTASPRAQLVVGKYEANIEKLQPGSIFNLGLEVRNLGGGEARSITMILGGGTYGSSDIEGTQTPGGVSGGGSDLSVFAPIGSSNIQYLGDLTPGKTMTATQDLIVNVSANPGAYTLKISFVYSDEKGNRQVDDQIITMLIYQLPQLEVNFYRDPGPIFVMAPNTIPMQVVNLGRKSIVLGNMTVTAENAELMNNTTLVGTLEPGGYFPLDLMLIPQVPGPINLKITINYTDDFNQPNVLEYYLEVMVQESMEGMIDPNMPGGMAGPGIGPDGEGMIIDQPVVEETVWQKVVRFFKGLFGLDSAPPQNEQFMPDEMQPDMQPVPSGPGGKG
jgi:hypothetical protein